MLNVEFLTSEKGRLKLKYKGFLYFRDRESFKVYWRCVEYQKLRCRARITTLRGNIFDQSKAVHNHIVDKAKLEAISILTSIRDKANSSRDPPKLVVSDAVATCTQPAAAVLPSVDAMKRTIQNVRRTGNLEPALPLHRRDIVLPAEFAQTCKGEDFLLYDSGHGDDKRMLVFGTRQNLRMLAENRNWHADGTFKVVPLLFYQLFTIHAQYFGRAVPLIYALLPNKKRKTYIHLLKALKTIEPNLAPLTLMIDYEMAVIKSFCTIFPRLQETGCFFHFSQCIWRKIQEEGLALQYENDVDFALAMKHLAALAFVPVTSVVQAFELLIESDVLPPEADSIIAYFEDVWIGKMNLRRKRSEPQYAHALWNVFEITKNNEIRTNNSVEAWHRGFETLTTAHHENIW